MAHGILPCLSAHKATERGQEGGQARSGAGNLGLLLVLLLEGSLESNQCAPHSLGVVDVRLDPEIEITRGPDIPMNRVEPTGLDPPNRLALQAGSVR